MSRVTGQPVLGRIERARNRRSGRAITRLLPPLGWGLAFAGYLGPWVGHATAALTLTGADMAEFVNFLPGVLDGSLPVVRQLFYLPPLAVAVGVALLVSCRELRYSWAVKAGVLALATLMSLQILPPAWSPASLVSPEFRLQTAALGLCWLLLLLGSLWGRLPGRLVGALSAGLSLAAVALSAWQFLLAKPAIDKVYGMPPAVGWGFPACMVGLAIAVIAGVLLVLQTWPRSAEL